MGYNEDDSFVRVDFFKPNGKWYITESVKWTGAYNAADQPIFDAFKQSLRDHLKGRLSETWAICLEPYHIHAHPLMVTDW